MRHKGIVGLLVTVLLVTINAQSLLSMDHFPGKCDNQILKNEIYDTVAKAIEEIMSRCRTDVGYLKAKIADLVDHMEGFSSKFQRLEREMKEIRGALSRVKNDKNFTMVTCKNTRKEEIKENGPNKDCASILKWNALTKGADDVYTIYPDLENPKKVFCDMTTDGGGWTVLQKRQDGSTDFNQTWKAYKKGFGNPINEYWIGNDAMNQLTKERDQILRIDAEDFNGRKGFATYTEFSIQDESQKYKLRIGGYNGNIGDSMWNVTDWRGVLSGKAFVTVDNITNVYHNLCTTFIGGGGGWWYNRCTFANLNAPYRLQPVNNISRNIYWYTFNKYNSLKRVKMMIRKKN